MFKGFADNYRHRLVRWVDGVRQRALLVVAASVLATLASFFYVTTHFSINTDTSDMLSPELEFRRHSRALSESFPQFSDNILIVIDGETPDLADDAALRFAERLRRTPELFGEVYDPAGDPFFRQNGLLYMDADELTALADRLAEAQPFLGVLWRDPSLVGLFRMLGLALDEAVKDDGSKGIPIERALNAIAGEVEAMNQGRFGQLSWRRLMTGEASVGPARRYIQIQPTLDFGSLAPAKQAMDAVRALAADMNIDNAHGLRLRMTGSAALADEELASVEEGMGLAGVVSLVLVIGLLMVGLKSGPMVWATLITLIMGLIWTAAFAIAALGQLNLISVAFAVLFIGLSVDFGIHFALRYKEDLDNFASHGAALRYAAAGVGGALGLSATAATIAFYSFLFTNYLGLAELGLIAGTGMFIALFANLTVLPALLTLVHPAPTPIGKEVRSAAVFSIAVKWPRSVIGVAIIAAIAAGALSSDVSFDFDPMNLRDPESESVATVIDMMSDSRTSPYTITVLTEDLPRALALAERLRDLDTVEDVETLNDYVPVGQTQKLETINEMALFLSPSLMSVGQPQQPGHQQKLDSFGAMFAKLEKIALTAAENDLQKSARRLLAAFMAIRDPSAEATVTELEHRLLDSLPGRLQMLKESLNAAPVAMADLPTSISARQVADDGRAKVTVYPKENLQQRQSLIRFVTDVRRVAPTATGAPVIIFEAGRAVIDSFVRAAGISVSCILVLLLIVFENLRRSILVFAMLSLAALWTVAASAVLSLPFNFANVIVLPLLFGLGVAGGIHFVMRDNAVHEHDGVMATSTPRAILFSALTTIGSFGSIALSGHPGTASMGMLLTIALVCTLVTTLLVLPAFLAISKGNK